MFVAVVAIVEINKGDSLKVSMRFIYIYNKRIN